MYKQQVNTCYVCNKSNTTLLVLYENEICNSIHLPNYRQHYKIDLQNHTYRYNKTSNNVEICDINLFNGANIAFLVQTVASYIMAIYIITGSESIIVEYICTLINIFSAFTIAGYYIIECIIY